MPEPRLLVSVRNAEEAIAIRNSGCAIIDVKEPNHGALGMADAATIRKVAATIESPAQLSLALGEVTDAHDFEAFPSQVTYLKLGLAGLGGEPNWQRQWLDRRSQADTACMAADRAACTAVDSAFTPKWVAVIYADHVAAASPEPTTIVDAAIGTKCSVVLIDTFQKRPGGSLFESLSVAQLIELRNRTTAAGLQFAIAGQLRAQHASTIHQVRADIIGIRGAACRSSDRQSTIDPTALAEFQQNLTLAH